MPEPTDNGTDDQSKPAKRRLRASPETIRERSQRLGSETEAKSQKQETKKSGPVRAFLSGFTWPIRKIGALFAAIGRFLGKFRIFRILGRILLPRYIRNSWKELRQVTWPDRRKSWQLTYAVIVFSIIFGIIVAIVDMALDKIFKELILK